MENLSSRLFDGIPGPTPWYTRPGTPTAEGFAWQQTQGVAWKDATEKFQLRGKTLLVGAAGIVAVFDFYNWIMRLDDSTLLAWSQGKALYDWSPRTRVPRSRSGYAVEQTTR